MRTLDAKKFKNLLQTKGEDFWLKHGEFMVLDLFKQASQRVPAYKEFLKKNKIELGKIKTIADLKKVPAVTKENYLKTYSFKDLCWDGKPGAMDMISVSSGSTGEPFFWLRGKEQEKETALIHEVMLQDCFDIDKKSTLFIVSFAMGMWVAGTLTHRCIQEIAQRYNMTVITPGINANDVLKIIKSIGGHYDQIILAGYPPFVKDIIDDGPSAGVNWKKHDIKFLFAAESFCEKWRDYIYKKVGSRNPLKDSFNIYGTADALIMGHETPLSTMIRRLAAGNKNDLYKTIFAGNQRTPTLVQYNPAFKFVDAENGRLLFSCFGGIPLIRYYIGDSGNVIKYSEMKNILASRGINIEKTAKANNISLWKLPFMYIYGRDDFTANLYGINVYPETIRDALHGRGIDKYVSGKFTMLTRNDKKLNQFLEINVELKNKASLNQDLVNQIKTAVVSALKNKNNEYNELYKALGANAEPQIILCQYGNKNFFTPGVKQKWHKKQ